jgi:hypothetical protein
MNHPSDLLVDLVDGSITPQDRAVVDAHLGTCARCRQDVALATAGRDALRSLPEPVVPAGLGDAAIAEAERRAREVAPGVTPLRGGGGRADGPAWYRWAGGAAAAAAALLVLVVALPNVGGDDISTSQVDSALPGDAELAPRAAETVEVLDVDLDVEDVQALALGYRAGAEGAERDTGATGASGSIAASDPTGPEVALGCLREAVPELDAQEPARLIAARFEGTPAYLGIFLSGPGAGQPPDTATVWVVSREGCEILSSTQASL